MRSLTGRPILLTLILALASHNEQTSACTLGAGLNKPGILSLHNQARERCGGTAKGVNPLTWDDDLACASQAWANKCVWKHSHTPGAGENIACGTGSNYGVEQGIQQWYNEIFQFRDGMSFTEATAHATQMCWKDTTHVGCGIAKCSASSMHLGLFGGSAFFLVCQYSPPGNIVGMPGGFSTQVFLPTDKSKICLANADSTSGSSSSSSASSSASTSASTTATTGASADAQADATPAATAAKSNPLSSIFSALRGAGSSGSVGGISLLGNLFKGTGNAEASNQATTVTAPSTATSTPVTSSASGGIGSILGGLKAASQGSTAAPSGSSSNAPSFSSFLNGGSKNDDSHIKNGFSFSTSWRRATRK